MGIAAAVIAVQMRVDQFRGCLWSQPMLNQACKKLGVRGVARVNDDRIIAPQQHRVGAQPSSLKKNQILR
jgi:hypothetical protein